MKTTKKLQKAFILLEDGTTFFGKALGVDGSAFGELCFNTGMTGYQEIFTDPSYYGQLMVTTNAHIGNYGVSEEDIESKSPKIAGLICKNFNQKFSRPAANGSLQNFFIDHKIVAISDVDTRALVSHIRDNGAMNAVISTKLDSIDSLKLELKNFPSMVGLELASKVSTKEPYYYGNPDSNIKIAALDLGIKLNILRNLEKRGAYIKVFPYDSSLDEMLKFKPNGFFLSNGPGDPEPLKKVIETTKEILVKNYPLFGICLGHQVIALANDIKTYKMFNGHRGINHPVLNINTGKGEITSQNHGFAVDYDTAVANKSVKISHKHLNDQTVAGLEIKSKNCFSVQYHPEAGPGPNDGNYLFDQFLSKLN